MALTPERIEEICAELRNTIGCSNTTLARAIEAEVHKQDTELIRQMLEALENVDQAMPFPVAKRVISAARARLGAKPS